MGELLRFRQAAGAAHGLDVVVEPDGAIEFDEGLLAVGDAFDLDLDVGVVDL